MKRYKIGMQPVLVSDTFKKMLPASVVLHLVVIFIFFATPLGKNISQPQILFVTFSNTSEDKGRPSAAAVVAPVNISKKLFHRPAPSETAPPCVMTPDKTLAPEEMKRDIIKENVFAEDRTAGDVSFSDSTISNADTKDQDISSSSSLGPGLEKGRPQAGADAEIAEARFGDDGAPKFVYREMPVYPALARRLGKEGRVVLKLLIDADGKLLNVEVVEAAGYGFTEASVTAVKKSIYAPGIRGGVNVATRALLPVSFRLQ